MPMWPLLDTDLTATGNVGVVGNEFLIAARNVLVSVAVESQTLFRCDDLSAMKIPLRATLSID